MKTARFSALIMILGVAVFMLHWEIARAAQREFPVLTEAKVQKFLKVFPHFAQWIKKNSRTMDRLAKSSDAMRIVTAARLAKDHQKFFQEHGWTYEEFLNTAQQLLQAYAAVETKESLKECRKGFESQRAEAMLDIQKNSNMTPEQKQMMLQYIKQAEESIKMAEAAFKDVPPANLELARKYREAIAGVLKAFD